MPSESLWQSISAAGLPGGRLHGIRHTIALADLAQATSLAGRREELRDKSVLLLAKDQLTAALSLIELDGVARRMVLCPPDLAAEHLSGVISDAQAEACVVDDASTSADRAPLPGPIHARPELTPLGTPRRCSRATEWVLLTSGTTGAPKLVLHTFASLTSALQTGGRPSEPLVWSTFYDIRRYGGLQVFLRGVHAGSLVLSDPFEPVGHFLARAAAAAVTHISGLPRTGDARS